MTTIPRKIDARIQRFIDEIQPLKYLPDIKNCCMTEKESLEKEYAPTTVKNYLERYREAAKSLPSKKQRDQIHSLMRIDRDKKTTIELTYARKVDNYTLDAIKIPDSKIPYFIEKAQKQLKRRTFASVCQGLSLLTGRRGVELVRKAHFYRLTDIDLAISEARKELPKFLINSPQEIEKSIEKFGFNPEKILLFWGQAKANNKSRKTVLQPYAIPVLGDVDDILEAFEWLRKAFPHYLNMDEKEINIKTQKQLNDANTGVKNLRNYGLDFTAEHCKFNVLRKTYAAINAYQLIPDEIEKDRILYSKILGHGQDSKGTAASYQYVRFVKSEQHD